MIAISKQNFKFRISPLDGESKKKSAKFVSFLLYLVHLQRVLAGLQILSRQGSGRSAIPNGQYIYIKQNFCFISTVVAIRKFTSAVL